MAAPTQRPNFLLIWIGILIFVMGFGMRAFVPEPSLRRASEASGASRSNPAPPAKVEEQGDVDPYLNGVPAPAPVVDQSLLVDVDSTLPDFIRLGPGESADAAPSAVLAGAAETVRAGEDSPLPPEPSRLDRLQPAPVGQGDRPRPARSESQLAESNGRARDSVARAPVLTISYPGSSFLAPKRDAEPAAEAEAPVVAQALVVQIAPDLFRVLMVVEDPAPASELEQRTVREATSSNANEAVEIGSEADPAPRSRQELVADLRTWLESREGRGELSPARLEWLREQLRQNGMDRDPRLRSLLIADLDRRELARRLAQLAEQYQNRG